METASFHPGRARVETKKQKKERLRKQKLEKRKKEQKKLASRCFVLKKQTSSWFLLPPHITQGYEFWIAMLKGNSFLSKRKSLLDEIEKAKRPIPETKGFDCSSYETFKSEYLVKAQHVMSFLYQNQKIRWILKNFFTKMRIQHFQPLNEVDPITLEAITEPIKFPSFQQRKVYVFEAKPFAKHIHNRLTNNEGHIPDPLFPKNPFTNEELSLGQTMSLIHQAQKYGHSSWSIEAFLSCRYDIKSFSIIHSKPLRLHALRTTMGNVEDWDSIDTLYDFIKTQHALHNSVFHVSIYKWAVNRAARAERMETWRKLCIKWYEVDILIDDIDAKNELFRVIEVKSLPLCGKPEDLLSLRKGKSPGSSDGSRSSGHAANTG